MVEMRVLGGKGSAEDQLTNSQNYCSSTAYRGTTILSAPENQAFDRDIGLYATIPKL
jgi:hypothetical protein